MSKKTALFFWIAALYGGWAYAQPTNDDFAHSVQLVGTNITYTANFDGATMEQGEPFNGASNTIWISWAAPATGYAQVSKATAPHTQYYGIYTGSSVDDLQPVGLVPIGANSIFRFLATEGTVYNFQFSGGADNITFYLQFQTFGASTNDNFTNAQILKGNNTSFGPASIDGATMEVGEPAHMGNIPQKSIWWKWQAPVWGNCYFNPSASLVSSMVLAVYTGDSVEALTLIAESTNSNNLQFSAVGGQTYYIAAAAPTNAIGDIMGHSVYGTIDTSTHIIPGNLLLEPSWEGTALRPVHWGKTAGGISGYVNQNIGGADGTTWPVLGSYSGVNAAIWQDFTTTPGHQYALRFATLIGGQLSSGSGDGQIGVFLDTNLLAVSDVSSNEGGFWHWYNYTFVATNTTSRLTFTNLARSVEMDAFSVVDASAPPVIATQPVSASSTAGGTAAFIVGLTGTSPLYYQWFFNNSPLDGQTNKLLVLDSLATNQAGNYQVIITNVYGAATSTVASLLVEAPVSATILSQPYGDTVPVGGYYNFSVAAGGTPPLTYQWFLNSEPIEGSTNSNLMLTNVQSANAGAYTVQVQNQSSVAWSLPAILTVVSNAGGGTINFQNKSTYGPTNLNAPVFDLDGITLLNGSNFLAQLYAGPSLDKLRPAGPPSPFQEGFNAGYFVPETITLANVMPGSNAVLQVCAWDGGHGTSYEQARASGGKFGKSNILQVPAGGGANPPQTLQGLQSFSLQAGLPYFEVGTIIFIQRLPPNTIVWELQGQPNSIYLIEKSNQSQEAVWQPYMVLTNITGTVTFTNTANSDAISAWFRARILD